MNRTLIYTIEKDNNSEKIEHFLRQRGYSRQLLTNLKQDSGSVQVNGQPRYMNERLSEGDQLVIHI